MSWRMEQGDCMKLLAGMDSSSVDHVICDPPYDAKTHGGVMSMKGKKAHLKQLGFSELVDMAHVPELLRVSKGWVICFCALEQLGDYARAAGDKWIRAGTWDRINGTPQLTGDRPAQGCDGVAIMWAGGKRPSWNGGGARAAWRHPRANGESHPTEKPVGLMELLVRQFTDYGETILDPFAGSGTTGVAAVRLGRNFIGCELLDEHARTAILRLEDTKEQMELSYKKRPKPKQLQIGGTNEHEESEDEGAGEGLPDHRPRTAGDEEQASGAGEEVGQVHGGDRLRDDRSGEPAWQE